MKTKIVFLATVAMLVMSLSLSAQWVTNGSDIYYNAGNVGVNTSTPGSKLHVHDGILRTSVPLNGQGIMLSFCDKSGTQGDTYHFYADFSGSNQDGNWINMADEWGNNIQTWRNASVGIATTDPQAKLDVNGDILISNNLSGLILTSPNGNHWKLTVDNSGNLSTSPAVKVTENKIEFNFNVYPNPAKNEINVEILNDYAESYLLEIIDVNGKVHISQNLFLKRSKIDISSLSDGVFLLNILGSEGIILRTQRIIKN